MKSTYDGQKTYTKKSLFFYNFRVLFFNNTFVWKCSTKKLLDQFKKYTSRNHLDIGVGTGFYLDKVRKKIINIDLMDLNNNCLNQVSQVLKDKTPNVYKIDILKDISSSFYSKYDSISFNYLIHCLPDNGNKDLVFKNVAKMLKQEGVAFGATVINDYKNDLAIKVSKKYNNIGKFDNKNDTYLKIEGYLQSSFKDYTIEQVGSVCLFSMRSPIK